MDKVAVIIVTYNGMKWLERCLSDLFQSTVPIEVYIIDNGSQDGTIDFVEKHYPQITFIKSEKNLGFGKANNIGISKAYEAGFDYFFLLNQDGYVFPETIGNLINTVKKHPEFGVASPIQLNGAGNSLDLNFSILMNNDNCPGFINDSYFQKLRTHYTINFVMAAFWLITRETINKVGLFNPVFPHYGEDNDYLNRVIFHGGNIAIVTNSVGLHDREFRETTIEKNIYISYIYMLIGLNNLNKSFVFELIRTLIFFIRQFFMAIIKLSKNEIIWNLKTFNNIIIRSFFGTLKQRKLNKSNYINHKR